MDYLLEFYFLFFFCGSKIDVMTVSYKVNMAISPMASLTELMWAARKNVLIVLNKVQNAHSRQVFLHFPHQFHCSCIALCWWKQILWFQKQRTLMLLFIFCPRRTNVCANLFFMWMPRNDPSEAKELNIKQPPSGDAAETRGQLWKLSAGGVNGVNRYLFVKKWHRNKQDPVSNVRLMFRGHSCP